MLSAYLTQTQRLLHDPNNQLYATADLTAYINLARGQIALEGECVRAFPTGILAAGDWVQSTSIFAGSLQAGASGVAVIRQLFQTTVPATRVQFRPWEWFSQFYANPPSSPTGAPTFWSVQTQGDTQTFFVNMAPAANTSVYADVNCSVSALATDSDPEAIPYPWTDCVPYFAAYLAYDNSQRGADAARMFQSYMLFAKRARQITTPSTLPRQQPGMEGSEQASRATPLTMGEVGGRGAR